MTDSETKFRKYLLKEYPNSTVFIKKLADAKQGAGSNVGLPDYLLIYNGKTIWFEVKQSRTKTTFNLNDISESQYITFDKMHDAGATIHVGVYVDKELYIVPYYNLRFTKFVGGEKSVTIETLKSWRIRW